MQSRKSDSLGKKRLESKGQAERLSHVQTQLCSQYQKNTGARRIFLDASISIPEDL